MLDADDPIDWRPQRIAVAGVTGVGKSTLARRVALAIRLPYTELDALYHGPGWQPRPSFMDDVRELVGGPRWVIEWQYPAARPLIAERADTLVWLDLPMRVALYRILRRTALRSLQRRELFNGNVEPPLSTVFTDRDHILRWALRTQRKLFDLVPAAEAEFPGLRVVRLRTRAEVDRWMSRLVEAYRTASP